MMTLDALISLYEARAKHALETGALLNGAKTWASAADELRQVKSSRSSVDDLLTTKEVGRRLNLKPETIAEYCNEGLFPNAYRTQDDSGPWRIPPADVDAYIRSMSPAAAVDETQSDHGLDQFLET